MKIRNHQRTEGCHGTFKCIYVVTSIPLPVKMSPQASSLKDRLQQLDSSLVKKEYRLQSPIWGFTHHPCSNKQENVE